MLKSKLTQILSGLDQSTFRDFGKFINSPYFNSNKKVCELYEILKRYYPGFDASELSMENLFRELYRKNGIVKGTMYFLFSETENLLERFLGFEKIDDIMIDAASLKAIGEMRLYNIFDIKYRDIKKRLPKAKDPDNIYRFLLSGINRHNTIERKEFLTKKDKFRNVWMEPVDELIKLFLKNMLWNAVLLSNFRQTLNDELHIPFYKELMDYAEKNEKDMNDTEMKILFYEAKVIIENDVNYFFRLKDLLNKNHRSILPEAIQEICTVLSNFCSYRILTGEDLYREQLEIQNLYLRHYIDRTKDIFPVDSFHQCFMLLIALDEIDNAKKFLEKYLKRLEDKFKSNAAAFGKASIYYGEKKYVAALKEIITIKNFTHIFYKHAVKVLQLKSFYELGLFSEGEDAANAFMNFLRHDKLTTTNVKNNYLEFIKFYKRLLTIQFSGSKNMISRYKFDLEKNKSFTTAKIWLIGKANGLELK
ncbi:MAG TPA: hypothetical protein PKC91_08160 [Ignavibacteria bacterium]|nr:hypothetical protein [Ignavibacteria bacterium]